MMRIAAVALILAVFLIFFGPSLMAWGRNLARQQKEAWREQEQTFEPEDDDDDRVGVDTVDTDTGSGDNGPH